MGTTERQTLAWSDDAPLRFQGQAATTATPEAVFAVLADHARWPEWFPKVKAVEVLGPAEGVGARRRVKIPGIAVDEEFIAWDPGKLFAFTATASRPGVFDALVEQCRIEPSPRGGCDLTWIMAVAPARLAAPVLKRSGRTFEGNLAKAMANLARRAESSPA